MIDERGNNRSRICLIGPAPPYRGGISHYNTCLAGELSKNHDVQMVNYSRLYPEFLFPGKTQFDDGEGSLSAESKRIIDSINPFSWVRAGFYVAGLRPDVTIVQWWHPYFAFALAKICAIIKMMRRGKVVFICHNVLPHENSPFGRVLSSLAFLNADGFVVQSREDLENLSVIKKNPSAVYHPHPIYDFFKTEKIDKAQARSMTGQPEGPLLLFFGYIRQYKGLDHLLKAMPEIHRSTGARLLVVGEFYEDSRRYFDLVSNLGIGEFVEFVDRYVGNNEVGRYFIASDLVMLPYISATQSGIAQIALAFDRPMVATSVGGLPEVVSEEKTGFIVPPSDPDAISKAVIRFFRDGWNEKMAPNFDKEKERFSWKAMVSVIEGLIEKL